MNIGNKGRENCCGCTACANICPHDAIIMEADELGFIYPHINYEKCVDCGLCVKICQFGTDYQRENKWATPIVYAARLKDRDQLSRSQSGGAFYGLAMQVLKQNGVVYGAGFAEHFHVAHKRVETYKELEDLRGSKYVQSDMRDIFLQVKNDLKAGRSVLFSGTPCQVSGLQSYVGKKWQPHLYTVDIVCHGVPSPSVWDDYVNFLDRRNGDRLASANFRDKLYGWQGAKETFHYKSGKSVTRKTYIDMDFRHLMHRPSCLICPYTNMNRCGDLTIGDFWGWDKISTEFNDNKGVSLVLINSDKGHDLLDEVASQFYLVRSNTTDCLQPQLQHPATAHPKRNAFISDYKKKGFLYVAKRYGNLGVRYRLALIKGFVVRRIECLRLKKIKK